MEMIFLIVMGLIGAFGWGMYAQEILTKRQHLKAREGRIVVDAPFSKEQSETIMRVLRELNDAIHQSIMKEEKTL